MSGIESHGLQGSAENSWNDLHGCFRGFPAWAISDCKMCKASAHDLGIVQMQAERREEGGAVYLMRTYFVRRLTARECWRLMDFSDSDYEKAEAVNSQSQLYREAGNSIVKNVLMAVFGQMLPGKEAAYNGRK